MVELAAAEAEVTPGSWPVILRNTTNKIRKAGCEYTPAEEERYSAKIEATPRSAKIPGRGKSTAGRRKAAEIDSDNDEVETPSKKPRKRATKANAEVEAEEQDAKQIATLDEKDKKVVRELEEEVEGMEENNFMEEFLTPDAIHSLDEV
jgi:hypothetical protein